MSLSTFVSVCGSTVTNARSLYFGSAITRVGLSSVPKNVAQLIGMRSVAYPSFLSLTRSSFFNQLVLYAFMIFTVFSLPCLIASLAMSSPSLAQSNPSSSGVLKYGGNTLPCAAFNGESTSVLCPFAKNQSSSCNHPLNDTPVDPPIVNASRPSGESFGAAVAASPNRAAPRAAPPKLEIARAPAAHAVAAHASAPTARAHVHACDAMRRCRP